MSAGCKVRGCGDSPGCLVDACNPSRSAIDSGDIVWFDDFDQCIKIQDPSPAVTCRCGETVRSEALLEAHWDECRR